MRLGFCSISALDRSLQEAAQVAAECGLWGLEVTAHVPHLSPHDGIEAARECGRAVRTAGIEVIAYGSYLGRFGQVTRSDALREAAIAAALGTRLVRVWAEPLEEGSSDVAPTIELMRAIADAALADGITVVIERHLGSFAETPEQINELMERIDRANVALNYQVLDFLPMAAAGQQALDAASLVGKAKYFHLKNYQANPDGEGPLYPGGSLESGFLDYRAILKAAVEAGYEGPMTIEFLAADERSVLDKLRADADFVRTVLQDLGVSLETASVSKSR